jgi:alkanesulfonate monooxygenase SsuD/methylene tetrahydromethanopterin reductase-like flavin-dependent oxidoreductase (luciferase family)
MLASLASPAGVSWAMGHVRSGEARRAADRGAVEVLSFLYVSLSDDRMAARAAVRRGIAVALMGSFPNLDFLEASGQTLTDELRVLLEPKVRDLPKIAAAIPDGYIDRLAIAGDVEECAARLREIVALGVDHIVLGPFPVDEGGAEALLADFATRVMPMVRVNG